MALGIGEYILAVVAALIIVLVLTLFTRFDEVVDRVGRETRTYEIAYIAREEKHQELETLFRSCGNRIRSSKRLKRNGEMVYVWELDGHSRDHACLADKLLDDKEIKELKY